MNTEPTDYELMELYRSWWEASYGTKPNSQATIIAAAWANHVLATYQQDNLEAEIVDYYQRLQAQHAGQGCVYHPAMTGEGKVDD